MTPWIGFVLFLGVWWLYARSLKAKNKFERITWEMLAVASYIGAIVIFIVSILTVPYVYP